jgi:hypothetical protein
VDYDKNGTESTVSIKRKVFLDQPIMELYRCGVIYCTYLLKNIKVNSQLNIPYCIMFYATGPAALQPTSLPVIFTCQLILAYTCAVGISHIDIFTIGLSAVYCGFQGPLVK